MPSPSEIILQYVCPAMGVILANLMFMAPLRDLQKAVFVGHGLCDLNPTPWAFMIGNCLGWTAYGIITNNWFVFWANCPGFLIACWLNLGAVKLLYSSHHQKETRRSLVQYLSEREREFLVGEVQPESLERDGDVQQQPQLLVRNDDEKNSNNNNNKDKNSNGNMSNENNDCDQQQDEDPETGAAATTSKAEDWAKIIWDVTSQITPAKTPHERLIMGIVILWTIVVAVIGFHGHYYTPSDTGASSAAKEADGGGDSFAQSVVGYVVNFNLVFFYGAPLSSILTVLRTKRSDSLHCPTMVTNTSNASFWMAYALAPQINDPFIYVPNGLGVVLGVTQLALSVVFPKASKEDTKDDAQNGNKQ